MTDFERFEFERSRGVVWVCDVVSSSKYLNDDQCVDDLETFLPRLHWTASMIVEAAGGKLVKWTGDGFLAWFETPLHRALGEHAAAVLDAAWHLTVMVNVTQLGVDGQREFKIRHGVTHEQDALLVKIVHPGHHTSLDVMGRAVTLAFRLSSVPADFPGIVTQKELIDASAGHRTAARDFRKWQVSAQDKLRYFKGERWGVSSLYRSTGKKRKARNPESVAKSVKATIAKVEQKEAEDSARLRFIKAFIEKMESGPEWCQKVIDDYASFVMEDLLGTLKQILPLLEKQAPNSVNSQD